MLHLIPILLLATTPAPASQADAGKSAPTTPAASRLIPLSEAKVDVQCRIYLSDGRKLEGVFKKIGDPTCMFCGNKSLPIEVDAKDIQSIQNMPQDVPSVKAQADEKPAKPPADETREGKVDRLKVLMRNLEFMKKEVERNEEASQKEAQLAAACAAKKKMPEYQTHQERHPGRPAHYGNGANFTGTPDTYVTVVDYDHRSFNQDLDVQAAIHQKASTNATALAQKNRIKVDGIQADITQVQSNLAALDTKKAVAAAAPPGAPAPVAQPMVVVPIPIAPVPQPITEVPKEKKQRFAPAPEPTGAAPLDSKDYDAVSALIPGRWQMEIGTNYFHRACDKDGGYADYDADQKNIGKGEWQVRGNGMVMFRSAAGKASFFMMAKPNQLSDQDQAGSFIRVVPVEEKP